MVISNPGGGFYLRLLSYITRGANKRTWLLIYVIVETLEQSLICPSPQLYGFSLVSPGKVCGIKLKILQESSSCVHNRDF